MMIEPDFGHWFAGFVAGEGCFHIDYRDRHHDCGFTLVLRDDDAAILEEIKDRLGFGVLTTRAARGSSKRQVGWEVRTKEDALKLVHVLDRFSLRAKKARDYAIWRRAVFAWNALDFERVDALGLQLREARDYKGPSSAV